MLIFWCGLMTLFSYNTTKQLPSARTVYQHYLDYAPQDSVNYPLPRLKAKGSYTTIKRTIKTKQQDLQTAYSTAQTDEAKDEIIKEAGQYITAQLVEQVFPHWYGTPWTFDGYTAIPNQGSVGCSYFVSTTLLHAGFNVNRYRLAQQGPVSEARSLSLQDDPISLEAEFDLTNFETLVQEKCQEGLYFIGLGHSHVGYLYYAQGEIYFIQSSYGTSMSVEVEYAMRSDILKGFTAFTLVPISTNKMLLDYWLTSKEIVVVKGKE